jgi:hypothetical protein
MAHSRKFFGWPWPKYRVAPTMVRRINYLAEFAIENIKRAVVTIVLHVTYEVFHLHFDAIAFVVLATFERLISESPFQALHGIAYNTGNVYLRNI